MQSIFQKKIKKRAALFWYGSFYLKSFQKIKKKKKSAKPKINLT